MKICQNCGAQAADTRHYCQKCGAPLIHKSSESIGKSTQKKTEIFNLRTVLLAVAVIALFAGIIFLSGRKGFTSPRALAEEYMALLKSGSSEEIQSLFAEELLKNSSENISNTQGSFYGTDFSVIGIYDVTDTSGLNSESAMREIRNTFGIELEIADYAQYLSGIVINDNDNWIQLDMIKLGKYWYIWRES